MARRRYRKEKETYRIELKVRNNIPLFTAPILGEMIIDGLRWCCDKRGLRLFEYMLLPSCLLMISNAAWGHVSDILASYRKFSSKAVIQLLIRRQHDPLMEEFRKGLLSKSHPQDVSIWVQNDTIRTLRNRDEADKAAVEMLSLPVKEGFADRPEDYRYCSAHPQNPLHEWTVSAIDPWS
ncbi:MAG: hypothetical protein GVY02_07975 [Bacteroidetes bacterium]|jgi:hypothetical protein|nr:hypothetical protein [Bacteroidota bacterium]